MSNRISLLHDLRVATPCPAKWSEMDGDDQTRFCHQCQKHVYNFSELTEAEITILLGSDDVCGRLYRRADGTILTADCPTGLRINRARVIGWSTKAAAFGLMLVGAALAAMASVEPNGSHAFASTPGAVALQRWIGRLAPEPQYYSGSILIPVDD